MKEILTVTHGPQVAWQEPLATEHQYVGAALVGVGAARAARIVRWVVLAFMIFTSIVSLGVV
jgi:hypothetical protein